MARTKHGEQEKKRLKLKAAKDERRAKRRAEKKAEEALSDGGSSGKRKRRRPQILSMGPRKIAKTKKKKQG